MDQKDNAQSEWAFPDLNQIDEKIVRNFDQQIGNQFIDLVHSNIVEPSQVKVSHQEVTTAFDSFTPLAIDEHSEKMEEMTEITDEQPSEKIPEENKEELYQKEIAALKLQLLEKEKLLQAISVKLASVSTLIDEEVVELINEIIKKTVYQVIKTEITKQPELVQKMIEQLKSTIDAVQGVITVYVSADDYPLLIANEPEQQKQCIYKIDETLHSGDIVVKAKHTEIRALLLQRIEQLLQVQHD